MGSASAASVSVTAVVVNAPSSKSPVSSKQIRKFAPAEIKLAVNAVVSFFRFQTRLPTA